MRALTSLDSFFLAAEDGRTNTNVSALAVIDAHRADGTALTREHLIDLVGGRLHLLAPLRWRLAEVPLGLGHPYWVDTEVDLEFHVRELALPAPGSMAQLEQQVARLAALPMDRTRPLWEIWLIHGLADGGAAVLTKLHHAAIDGVSGAEIMSVLFDGSPEGRALAPAAAFRGERMPGQVELVARGVLDSARQPLRAMGAAWRTVTHLDHVATVRGLPGTRTTGRTTRKMASAAGIREDGDLLDAPRMQAPRTHLNGTVTRHRRYATVSLPLADVRSLKERHGTTVNDVVVALCSGALRSWLGSTAQLPAEPLVAAIPVSVRTEEQRGTFGNLVGTMVVPLPTDRAEPAARLAACRDELRVAKERHRATPASLMRDSTELVPPVLFGRVTRALTRLAATEGLRPAANVVISNVPGSQLPLYCAGAEVREHYPVSTISDSLGLNITVFSYRDQLNVGLVADRDLVPELEGLATALRDELATLQAAPVAGDSATTGAPVLRVVNGAGR